MTLAGHFTVTVGFCRSEHNPADRPSRQFKKRPRRGAPHFGKTRSSDSEGDGPRPKGAQKQTSGQIVARGRVLDVASKASRAEARAKLGALSGLKVKPQTLRAYDAALKWFFAWLPRSGLSVPAATANFDEVVAEAIGEAWAEGEARALVGNLLSGLQHRVPNLKGRLHESWKLWRL